MDLNFLGIAGIASITIVCFLIGMIAKASNLDNKWIPCICGAAGAILGILAMRYMPSYPGTDYITAVAIGIVSGLGATGANQMYKQFTKEA